MLYFCPDRNFFYLQCFIILEKLRKFRYLDSEAELCEIFGPIDITPPLFELDEFFPKKKKNEEAISRLFAFASNLHKKNHMGGSIEQGISSFGDKLEQNNFPFCAK